MRLKTKFKLRFRDLAGITQLEAKVDELTRDTSRLTALFSSEIPHVISLLEIVNHNVASQCASINEQHELMLAINHRSFILEEIATRLSALDYVAHRLKDLEIVSESAARRIAVDTDSVALMITALEKLILDLTRETRGSSR